MLGINMMGIAGFLFNPIIKAFYRIVFGFYRAIASVLDVLTHLFYIFSGMTPISSTDGTTINGDGRDTGVDIVNYFVQREDFIDAYIGLCLVALGLIVVFTIAKIIKQDYFDRAGPRSKAPIFRNVALSFIAFICVIPVFMFIIQAAGLLATIVMKQFGLDTSQGVGTMLFYLSWNDGGTYFMDEYSGEAPELLMNMSHFGEYSIAKGGDILYNTFWNAGAFESIEKPEAEFYWYMFIITGFILIVNLGKMMIAMVTRLYKMIALFIIAPSPISQIVIDDGQKFKKWKDDLIKETLKVVGCVMCFMVFILIAKFVPTLDLTKFVGEDGSGTIYKNLIEDNNLTAGISSLYYESTSGGIDPDTGKLNLDGMDAIVNALGKCVILIAGVGAIQDMDSVITPLLSGGSSSMELGNAGNAVIKGGMAAAKGAWDLGKLAVSKTVGLAGGIINGVGGFVGKGIGIATEKPSGGTASSIASNVGQGGSGGNGEVNPVSGRSPVRGQGPADQEVPEQVETPTDNANQEVPEQVEAPTDNANQEVPEQVETPTDNANQEVPEQTSTQQSAGIPAAPTRENGSSASEQIGGTSSTTPFSRTAGGKAARIAAHVGRGVYIGIPKGAAKLAWGGVKTTAKAGSIMLKTLLSMTGMGAVAKGLDQVEKDVVGGVTKVGSKMFGKKRDKDGKPIVKRDENGNVVKDKYGKPVYEYNSAFGAGVAGITSRIGGTLGQYLTDEGVAANLDRIDARGRARAEEHNSRQNTEQVLGENNTNLSQVVNEVNENPNMTTDDLLASSQTVIDESNNIGDMAEQVNAEHQHIAGSEAEQLVTHDGINEQLAAAQTENENVNSYVEASSAARNQIAVQGKGMKSDKLYNVYSRRHAHGNSSPEVGKQRIAKLNAIMRMHSQARDENERRELEKAYMYVAGGGNAPSSTYGQHDPQAETIYNKYEADINNIAGTINTNAIANYGMKDQISREESFERGIQERTTARLQQTQQQVTVNDRRVAATERLQTARAKLQANPTDAGARQEVIEAMNEVRTTASGVTNQSINTYHETGKISKLNQEKNEAYSGYNEQVQNVERLFSEAQEAGVSEQDLAKLRSKFEKYQSKAIKKTGKIATTKPITKGVRKAVNKLQVKVTKVGNKVAGKHQAQTRLNNTRENVNSTLGRTTTVNVEVEGRPVQVSQEQRGQNPQAVQTQVVESTPNTNLQRTIRLTVPRVEEMCANGTINDFLGVAYTAGVLENNDNVFEEAVNLINQDQIHLNDEQLAVELDNITEKGDYQSVALHRSHVSHQYTTTRDDYNQAISRAADCIREFKANRSNTEKLAEAKKAIEEAVSKSVVLKRLRDEMTKK